MQGCDLVLGSGKAEEAEEEGQNLKIALRRETSRGISPKGCPGGSPGGGSPRVARGRGDSLVSSQGGSLGGSARSCLVLLG